MYKVLVAEDELIERKVLIKTLRQHFGDICQIYEAKNGKEAMELYEQEHHQIAILDIQMPGLSGLEVARQIRTMGLPCSILFLSAYDLFSYARQAISVRASDYLLKPYDEKELMASVEEAIRLHDWVEARGQERKTLREDVRQREDTSDERLGLIRENIERYIQNNFGDDLSMQDAARAMNYSDAYFCKLFKQCFKVNFSTYLNEYRVEHAKKLLAETAGSIKEISISCGYADSNYFTRVFRRITGMTPSEFRLSLTKQE